MGTLQLPWEIATSCKSQSYYNLPGVWVMQSSVTAMPAGRLSPPSATSVAGLVVAVQYTDQNPVELEKNTA